MRLQDKGRISPLFISVMLIIIGSSWINCWKCGTNSKSFQCGVWYIAHVVKSHGVVCVTCRVAMTIINIFSDDRICLTTIRPVNYVDKLSSMIGRTQRKLKHKRKRRYSSQNNSLQPVWKELQQICLTRTIFSELRYAKSQSNDITPTPKFVRNKFLYC